MDDPLFTIRWTSGDKDERLTQGLVLKILAQEQCKWLDGGKVVDAENKQVGTVVRVYD